ncbi:MAG: type I-C CRISPR-associated protein Cas5 [Acidobacteria bacterium]|nr:type I-C CRISPR-associated protein Cas5 [Acidobacteriota bacterium]
MRTRSKDFLVHIAGPLACFTRPELKTERVSYDVMTPSAARGALEAVLWKPAITWQADEIVVLNPIDWVSFRRNEVNSRSSPRMGAYFADEDRAQRNTVALRDVAYVVKAHFVMTEKAGAQDNVGKFEEMFERRLAKGQCFQQPYLGCREFAADIRPVAETITVDPALAKVRRPLGLMFYDFDFRTAPPKPLFFEAFLQSGVLRVPALSDVLAENGGH